MELFGVGAAEAFLVLLVTLLVVGPHRFPQIARDGARWYKVARRYATEVMGDVRGALDEIEQEMNADGTDLREVLTLTEEVKRDLDRDLREVEADTARVARETGEGLRTAGEAPTQRVTVARVPRPAGVTGRAVDSTSAGPRPARPLATPAPPAPPAAPPPAATTAPAADDAPADDAPAAGAGASEAGAPDAAAADPASRSDAANAE